MTNPTDNQTPQPVDTPSNVVHKMADKQTVEDFINEYVGILRQNLSTEEQREEAKAQLNQLLIKERLDASRKAWDEGFDAGWAECKDPGAFVNDVWDAETPNPYSPTTNLENQLGEKS